MKKKFIKQLVLNSYKTDELDEKEVTTIADRLNRHDLKQYIHELKNYEKKKNVYVSLPYPPTSDEQKALQLLFPKKKIAFIIDPSLGVGVKITNNDLITEMNFKDTLEDIMAYTTQDYD